MSDWNEAIQQMYAAPIVAEQQGGATTNAKIARARRALERIRNVGKDRSEKLWFRIDDMVEEAEEAMRFLALPTVP